jgi:hypothetical protein
MISMMAMAMEGMMGTAAAMVAMVNKTMMAMEGTPVMRWQCRQRQQQW